MRYDPAYLSKKYYPTPYLKKIIYIYKSVPSNIRTSITKFLCLPEKFVFIVNQLYSLKDILLQFRARFFLSNDPLSLFKKLKNRTKVAVVLLD